MYFGRFGQSMCAGEKMSISYTRIYSLDVCGGVLVTLSQIYRNGRRNYRKTSVG